MFLRLSVSKSPDRKSSLFFPDPFLLLSLPPAYRSLLSPAAARTEKRRRGAFKPGEVSVNRHSDAAAALDDRVVLARRASGNTSGLADRTGRERVGRLEGGQGELLESVVAPSRSEEAIEGFDFFLFF